jgi:hypothetical protein
VGTLVVATAALFAQLAPTRVEAAVAHLSCAEAAALLAELAAEAGLPGRDLAVAVVRPVA